MAKDIKIFVSHRIDLDSETIDNPLYVPVRCGAVFDKRENVTMLGDDTGDNISEKRESFCELTVQYWAWKNVEADYYGLCHYRRLFSFSDKYCKDVNVYNHIEEPCLSKKIFDKYGYEKEIMENLICNFDIIKIFPMKLPKHITVYESLIQNKRTYDKKAIDLFIKIVKEKYPELSKYMDDYMCGHEWQAWNCYIMKKEYFVDYSKKLFDVLFELESRLDISEYNVEQIRMVGYMGEIFFPVYLNHLINKEHIKLKNLQLIEIKNTNIIKEIKPVWDNAISIAMASSNEYVPFLSSLLQSIKDNASKNHNYDVIVLENKISDENKDVLLKQIDNNNFSLRFIDISRYLDKYNFYIRDHVTPMTYMRLAIPSIFKNYNKIIYLDCDLVVNIDLKYLYEIDIEKYLLGAARDSIMASWSNSIEEYKDYCDKLNMHDKYSYFNAGVLLVNVKKFNQIISTEKLFSIASEKNWKWFDQDVLNTLCTGNVKLIDQKWNFMSHRYNSIYELPEYYAPANIYKDYLEAAKNPYIVHYAGRNLPCYVPDTEQAIYFWKYARKSPYYEKILQFMVVDEYFKCKAVNGKKQKIKSFIKIFFPTGTRRHKLLKKFYFKLRGWPI